MRNSIISLLTLILVLLIASCEQINDENQVDPDVITLERTGLGIGKVIYLVGGYEGAAQDPWDCPKGGGSCATGGGLEIIQVNSVGEGVNLLESQYPQWVLARLVVQDEENAIHQMVAVGDEYPHLEEEGDILNVGQQEIVYPSEIAEQLGFNHLEIAEGAYQIKQKTDQFFWNGNAKVNIITQ